MVLSVTKWLFGFLAVLVIVILFYAFALPRPADTADPAIFMKDGRSLNYCDLPVRCSENLVASLRRIRLIVYTNIPMPF